MMQHYGLWPSDTTATASSVHPPLANCADGDVTCSFNASYAIDNDLVSKWNDNTLGDFPDTLTITTAQSVQLDGIVLISATEDGYITDFSIDVSSDASSASLTQVAQMSNVATYNSTVSFAQTVTCKQLEVIINNAQDNTANGDYSRILEIYPIYAAQAASNTSSSSNSSSSSSSSTNKTSTTPVGAIAGGVVGGVLFLAFVAGLIWMLLRRKRNRNNTGHRGPQDYPLNSNSDKHAENGGMLSTHDPESEEQTIQPGYRDHHPRGGAINTTVSPATHTRDYNHNAGPRSPSPAELPTPNPLREYYYAEKDGVQIGNKNVQEMS